MCCEQCGAAATTRRANRADGCGSRRENWGREGVGEGGVTIETGFQVVVGAALGCQLVPPVILFSPGWLQWMSLRIRRLCISSSLSPPWEHRAAAADAAAAALPHCQLGRLVTYFFIVPFPMPRSEGGNACNTLLSSLIVFCFFFQQQVSAGASHSLPTRLAREESRSSDTSFSGWPDGWLEPATVGFKMPTAMSVVTYRHRDCIWRSKTVLATKSHCQGWMNR